MWKRDSREQEASLHPLSGAALNSPGHGCFSVDCRSLQGADCPIPPRCQQLLQIPATSSPTLLQKHFWGLTSAGPLSELNSPSPPAGRCLPNLGTGQMVRPALPAGQPHWADSALLSEQEMAGAHRPISALPGVHSWQLHLSPANCVFPCR